MEKELTETNMNSRPIEDIDELLWKFINVALHCVVSDLILSAALSPSPSLTLPENEHIKHKVNVCVTTGGLTLPVHLQLPDTHT